MELRLSPLATALVFIYFGASLPGWSAETSDRSPSFKKVFIVMFENTNYQSAIKQPTFSKIAQDGALLTNFHAENHPSQGNYIALVAGSAYGVTTDNSVNLDVKHIGDLLEGQGRTWKIYLEGYPGGCLKGSGSGMYERKHNPFISFKNIQNDTARCSSHLVDAKTLSGDIQNGTIPDYSLYIPDDNHNGHDTGVAYADKWLSGFSAPLFSNPQFMQDMLFIVTFDENAGASGNQVYTALYGSGVMPKSQSNALYNHTAILRTIEDAFSLGTLGQDDDKISGVKDVWK